MFGSLHIRRFPGSRDHDADLHGDRTAALVAMVVLVAVTLLALWLAALGQSPLPNLEYWPVVP
jgi:hypothetical protein